jgi:archaemetzincin
MTDARVYPLGILSLGAVDQQLIGSVVEAFAEKLEINVKLFTSRQPPAYAFDRHRIQYDAALIIKNVEVMDFKSCRRVVALVDVDLFVPVFTFVFGEARRGGRAAVASVARLRDQPERIVKITLHEFGHLCMLDHCHQESCVMNFSSDLATLDRLPPCFCRYCLDQVRFMAHSPVQNDPMA